jgi:26S proteasome regulatory subunit (ATPase 3-interacting protein)
MDATISILRNKLPGLRSTLKIATTKLATLTATPSSSELAILVDKLRTENEKKQKKLEGYKSGSEKLVSKEEIEGVDKEYRYWNAKRQARKRAFDVMEDYFLAGMSREELWEKAGIEGE